MHVFLSLARLLGFSARYVSGYLMMNNNNIQNASHAWAEVYLNQLGWIGLDISNFISPNDKYIRIASGFDYYDVIPISGIRSEKVMKNFPQKLLLSSSFIHNLKSNYKKVLIDFILISSLKNTKKLLKSIYLSFYLHYWKNKKSIRIINKINLDLTL